EILTAREREILQLLADGMSNADVAQQLFISQETVKSHVRNIVAKLEAEPRTHAVRMRRREAGGGGTPPPGGGHGAPGGKDVLGPDHGVAERLLAERAERRRIAEQLH